MKTKYKLFIPVFVSLLLLGFSSCLRDILNKNIPIDDKIQEILDEESTALNISQVTLSRSSLSLGTGEFFTLTASSKDSSYKTVNDTYTWTTSNSNVATVSNGTVKAFSLGSATIKAASKANPSKYASCTVTVSSTTSNIYSVNLSTSSILLAVGATYSIAATSTDYSGNYVTDFYTWTTSNSNVATVTGGLIRAISTGTATIKATSKSNSSKYASCTVTVSGSSTNPSPSSGNAHQFFWGTWVRMDKGTELVVEESYIIDKKSNSQSAILTSSDENTLYFATTLNGISSLTRKTENVIESKIGDAVIPFYRKGGTNLSYSLKVVGFTDDLQSGRAATSVMTGKAGLKVKGSSDRFASFEDEGITDENGSVNLTAPVQGDTQTVTIQVSDDKEIIVENLKIENDGSYMGAIPIVNDNDPVLKVSGFIAETSKTNGYLYSGNSYVMTINIQNIGDVTASASVLEILPNDSSIISIDGIDSSEGIKNPQAFTIPTLKPGVTLERKIRINVQSFARAYEDTKINVRVMNIKRTWEDFIPLRVHRENKIFTIAAKSQMNNSSAALNGFIIYPDGNNQFFTVSHDASKQIQVPSFTQNDSYIFVFSGATTEGKLDETTELFYTVSFNQYKKDFTFETTSSTKLLGIMSFGEEDSGNETEYTAYPVTKDFEAYIAEGETDFYKVNIQ